MCIIKKLIVGLSATMLAVPVINVKAETKTNAGTAYLLSQTKDISEDFCDLSNTYFFADSLVNFDTKTGVGELEWKRQIGRAHV